MKSVALPTLKVDGYSRAKSFIQILVLAVVLLIPWNTHAQKGGKVTVTGQILDADGVSLPGTSVKVSGTTIGTTTDVDGKFSVEADETATLEISSVGYETQQIKVQGQSDFTVKMQTAKKNSLNDVVVIGYGTAKKSDVTGSVVSINDKVIKESPVANLAQAMQGRAAGVNVQTTSPRPGGESRIRIRGQRSLTEGANEPLIVLDGIPFGGSLNDINTNEIKSIDVLKDASATAIYGSRGANGVILVTTNRGRTGKAQISYSGYQGINTVSKKYEVYNGEEFKAMRDISGYGAGNPYLDIEKQYIAEGKSTDWQDLIYKTGRIADHQLNVSGGTENTQYAMGLGYHDETSVIPGQEFQRYALKVSVDQKLSERIKVGASTQTSYSIIDGESVSLISPLLNLSPLLASTDANGKIIKQPAYPTEDIYNPLYVNQENNWSERRKRLGSYNNLYAEIKIIEGLKYRFNLGLNLTSDNYGQFISAVSPFNSAGQPSNATVSNSTAFSYTAENILQYDKTIKKHRFGLTGLFSAQKDQSNASGFLARGIVSDNMQYYNLGYSYQPLQADPSKQTEYTRKLLSGMFRMNYSFDDRFLFTFTVRADGASVLADGHKWNYYPALAAGWNIQHEHFMDNAKWVSALKLRLGYGQTSNQAIQPYQTFGGMTQNRYNFGTTNSYGYYVTNLPNSQLSWEYSKTFNAGVDFGFFDSRITGALDVYTTHTYDVLLPQQLPATSGVQGYFLNNVGETQNKGVELSISTANIRKADGFNWTTDFNIFMNRNKITQLSSGVTQDLGNGWFVGQPIDVIYDYEKVGIWQTSETDEAKKYGQKPGQIKLNDLNGDGKINDADRKVLGSFQPKFEGGITNRFAYKSFDLTVVAYGRYGGKLVSTIFQPQSYLNNLNGRRNGIKVDYWTPDNPTGTAPMPDASIGDNPLYGSTLGYFDASYLQIRTISFGYHIKDSWMSKIGGASGYIYATVNNVATLFSPYMDAGGISPEANGTGGQGVSGIGNLQSRQLTIGANTPLPRSFIIGARVTF